MLDSGQHIFFFQYMTKMVNTSLIFINLSGRAASEESLMFKDFDYISPEMSDRFNSSDKKEDPSTTLLPDEMQELRIRGFGP